MMRKKKVAGFLSFLCLLFPFTVLGCQQEQERMLTSHTPMLNERMQAYFQADAIAMARSAHFEAKLLKSVKTKRVGSTVYHYQIVIAPCTDKRLRSFTFLVYPSDALKSYFRNDYGANDMGGSPSEHAIYEDIDAVDKINPIECRLSWSNLGDQVQQRAGISEEAFDEGMKEIHIQVFYDTFHIEWLTLKWTAPHPFLDDPSDPAIQNDPFLRVYFPHGERLLGRHYYPFHEGTAPEDVIP